MKRAAAGGHGEYCARTHTRAGTQQRADGRVWARAGLRACSKRCASLLYTLGAHRQEEGRVARGDKLDVHAVLPGPGVDADAPATSQRVHSRRGGNVWCCGWETRQSCALTRPHHRSRRGLGQGDARVERLPVVQHGLTVEHHAARLARHLTRQERQGTASAAEWAKGARHERRAWPGPGRTPGQRLTVNMTLPEMPKTFQMVVA